MRFSTKSLYKILKDKGIKYLYHANTVITSCHFLRRSALLSRAYIEKRELPQTGQYTDAVDRKYGIWNNIFVDSCDIHRRLEDINYYGPVLFKIKTEILNSKDNGDVWITRNNPSKWHEMEEEDYWFESLDQVKEDYSKFSFGQIIVFRHCRGRLPINGFLESVILDNPDRRFPMKLETVGYAMGALKLSYALGDLYDVKFRVRKCESSCRCKDSYRNFDKKLLRKNFSPLATYES